MNYSILVLLAIVIVSAVTLAYVMPLLVSKHGKFRFEDAVKFKQLLLSEGGFTVSEELYVEVITDSIDIGGYFVPIARVKIVFPVENAPIIQENEFIGLYANQTHAGLITFIDVRDTGSMVEVIYVNSTPMRTRTVRFSGEAKVEKMFALENGIIVYRGSIVYSWTGYRIVEVKQIKITP